MRAVPASPGRSSTEAETWAEAWAASGAMALTGRADGPPLVPPDGIVARATQLGRSLSVDVLGLLGERAAAEGLSRRGERSCGGAARLVRAADGWLAINLAREDDRAAVPAWLGLDLASPGGQEPVDRNCG